MTDHDRDDDGSSDVTLCRDRPVEKPPSESIVTAISEREGTPPTELNPLHEVVDVDALNSIFGARSDGTPREVGSVSFQYCGYHVTIFGDGQIVLVKRE